VKIIVCCAACTNKFNSLFFYEPLTVALVTSIVIWILDTNASGLLNMTPRQREVFERNRL